METERRLVLQANGVSIVFGGLRAVSGFSCSVREGELLGLIGPNGAGKTTVFNMLSGIYAPTSGDISFWNREGAVYSLNKKKQAEISRLGISRTFQNIRLFNNLSAADNVRIALHGTRMESPLDALFRTPRFRDDERMMTEKAMSLLELFGIASKADEAAKNLPYGEQRKLEIARALAQGPSLLLLDEPAAGMNPQETAELMKLISFIRSEFALTILLIEHDMRLVMGICERLIVLDYGRIIAEGQPEEIQANPAVIKAYLGTEAAHDA